MKERSLMKRLISAGYPVSEMFHHELDLYVYVTPLSERVVREWCSDFKYSRKHMCPMFVSNIDGRLMYDCAFAYEPSINEVGV